MAKKASRKKSSKKKTSRRGSGGGRSSRRTAPDTEGKHLVIVESPTKAKTINRYLGPDYAVMASVGHVRDLPGRNPKGVDNPVPGVDLDNDFAPTYEVMPDKKSTITDLRKAAKKAADVWFATDLDREGEAIAWHLAKALDVEPAEAKRVVFNAITKREIDHAFSQPRSIDESRVNAQQARRILDRIVGYQVSPLLWKKVAGKLSAGRVQSVAVRLCVEREREIDAFVPDEFWKVTAFLTPALAEAVKLAPQWREWQADVAEGKSRTQREQYMWLAEHDSLRAELVEWRGSAFKPDDRDVAISAAEALGLEVLERKTWEDAKAKGPAQRRIEVIGRVSDAAAGGSPAYVIRSIETKRTTSRPGAPFITSTMQQAAANALGFQLQRTMRIAQQLYEGVDIHGAEGQTGLITYMRTDSTHLSPEAINMARGFIGKEYGDAYLPDKPNFFTSSNKAAQEAHEAIRPTDVSITPQRVRRDLTEDQFKLYRLIWQRFVSSQMTPAQWDSTSVLIDAKTSAGEGVFKSTGRTLVFDGFYKASGVPTAAEPVLPPLDRGQQLGPFHLDAVQSFTNPPARYTEASLQKKLEEEGIGRPSTYASIIQTIQDRKYVQPLAPRDRRLYATDLGMVVTDKLVEAFPRIMDVAYTREMESELDKIETDHHDWVKMLHEFYGPFKDNLEEAHRSMVHAKAETQPAPHKCEKCGAETVYRFGRNGRFLSCSRYPDCDYAAPIDREGNPVQPEMSDILCPLCGSGMTRRRGRFGAFLGCVNYPECKGILKLDPKKHHVVLPKTPPLETDVPCPKCESPLNMRDSKRGLWLSCSRFPKCRGRVGWSTLEEDKQKELEAAWQKHLAENPAPVVRTADGRVLREDEEYIPNLETLEQNGESNGGQQDGHSSDNGSAGASDADAA